jgi:hypothetical protein
MYILPHLYVVKDSWNFLNSKTYFQLEILELNIKKIVSVFFNVINRFLSFKHFYHQNAFIT